MSCTPVQGRVIAGCYRLLQPIGKGGMGCVWRAENIKFGGSAAVKLINASTARYARARTRFAREAKIAATLKSTHLTKLLDYGETEDGVPFIAMEFLQGYSLKTRLTGAARLTPQATARLVTHVARALTQAHSAGLVHRDLKPDNIFIAYEGESEICKVLDFGVAKATDVLYLEGAAPTKTGILLGTPFYMSPEQTRGLKTLDHRSDLWSLGVVAYRCLTGKLPIAGDDLSTVIARIQSNPILPPSSIAADNTSPEIDEWMSRALCREPEERFNSAQRMADALNLIAGNTQSLRFDSPSPDAETQRRLKHHDRAVNDSDARTLEISGHSNPTTRPELDELATTTNYVKKR